MIKQPTNLVWVTCPHCRGSGKQFNVGELSFWSECDWCGGTSSIQVEQKGETHGQPVRES